ncbi:MAG: hypothetical protein B6D78_15760 [gamma proteobacterium symbiont of Ctena orbiculata]|nr:MAG: hypothetical protein DBP02_14755 [gamma proteobacterium symbiont of Ctena orbiculata]PVV16973.1 MAG: hypothetical protein B6D79_17455 [gamma proteobacterium symbiont of Ctena orbiculata]PVV18625.1 MAG: hypothetical protein B6D78_15760 [gamma proteobacterium symbiont of Ctena orbiculata]
MINKIVLVLTLLLLTPLTSFAENNDAISIVTRGLEAYTKGGAKAAIESWIKDSGLEGSKEALAQANVLRQVEDYYGEYVGYDIVKDHQLTKRVHMIVFVMNYTKGPLFGRFQSYRSNSGKWVATEFKFHTEAVMVLPKSIVFGE